MEFEVRIQLVRRNSSSRCDAADLHASLCVRMLFTSIRKFFFVDGVGSGARHLPLSYDDRTCVFKLRMKVKSVISITGNDFPKIMQRRLVSLTPNQFSKIEPSKSFIKCLVEAGKNLNLPKINLIPPILSNANNGNN